MELGKISRYRPKDDCPSCILEKARRLSHSGKLSVALLQVEINSMKEYIDLREREAANEQYVPHSCL